MNECFCNIENKIKKSYAPLYISFIKWLLMGAFMGIFIGLVGTAFYYSIETATDFRKSHSWIIWLLPIGGIAIVEFYNAMGYRHDKGTNLVLLAVRDNKKMGFKHTICIFVASVITHLFGGSSGREGAALQIGGSIASQFGRIFKLDEDDKRILTMCGMSAGFSALFGTPVTASFFAMEVVSIGIFHYSAIVPCIVSAVIAKEISAFFGVTDFELIVNVPDYTAENYIKVLLLAVLCALLSCLFCTSTKLASDLYKKIKNRNIRAFTGGLIVAVLTFLLGTYDYNGAGGEIIEKAFVEQAGAEVFLLKILFTVLTLCAGFKGGEIVPVFFIGSTFGSLISGIIGLDFSIGASIGMTALFCGVTNCPIASILLSLELFGSEGIVFYTIGCAIAYMLSGYQGLYSEQKILYSKRKTKFINKTIGGKH